MKQNVFVLFVGYNKLSKIPTMSLNTRNNKYHCMRCGAGGYSIGLYAKMRNIDNKKAFKELLTEYEWATYKEHNDRHEFFRKQVEKMVNDFGFQDEELAKEMANDHPTLQQSFMRMVCLFIHEMAQKEHFDDRNKGSVSLAKELDPIIKEKGYLPCI